VAEVQITDIMADYKERLAVTTEELIVARAQIAALQRQLQEEKMQEVTES
jgi:hypothetical protein